MNNNGKGLLMSWPRYVEGTTSISRLMHKQTYLTFYELLKKLLHN